MEISFAHPECPGRTVQAGIIDYNFGGLLPGQQAMEALEAVLAIRSETAAPVPAGTRYGALWLEPRDMPALAGTGEKDKGSTVALRVTTA